MSAAAATSIVDLLLGLALGSADPASNNRFSIEGLTVTSKDGGLEIGMQRLEAASLRVGCGPLVLELGQLALHSVVALVKMQAGRPRLGALAAASAEIPAVKLHGPVSADIAAGQAPAGSWCLGPLAAADGTMRAKILDAHLLFDADVTVPIRDGQIHFKDATVAHVGPDSRMGVSRLGLYVDAPNGRSYLYQFSSAPMAGVEYERRGAVLGPWVTDRGHLRLQPFGESLLRQPAGGPALRFTEQARHLFDRTAISGDVQLGDGKFAAPGAQAELAGRADGRNLVRVHSEAVGRGLTIEVPSLSVCKAILEAAATQLHCEEAAGAVVLRLFVEGAQVRFALDLTNVKLSGLRLQLPARD
ncbi:MAG: hypothetical protein JWP41_1162 [Ramlibacter sp.]|nr:hypothetical protein [Ramlibacter sp.]